jgi:hypothetical protein
MIPTIELDSSEKHVEYIPREKVNPNEKWIKHVHCDGARFHVLAYSTKGIHCSEPDCIYNKPIIHLPDIMTTCPKCGEYHSIYVLCTLPKEKK